MSEAVVINTTEDRAKAVTDLLDHWLTDQLRGELYGRQAANLLERQLIGAFILDLEDAT